MPPAVIRKSVIKVLSTDPKPTENIALYTELVETDTLVRYQWDGANWILMGGAGGGDMYKSVYDPDDNGVVKDSDKLAGKTLSEVRDHTPKAHTHPESEVTNLEADLASKEIPAGAQAKVDTHAALPDVHHTKFTQADHDTLPNPHHPHTNDPTDDEKAALYGTDGVPSGANKFVTDSDPRNTNPRTPTAHIHEESEVTGLESDLATIVVELGTKSDIGHGHSEAEVAGLVSDLAGKAPISHSHPESEIINLVSDLAAKASLSHSHAESEVTGLVSDLAGKLPTSSFSGLSKISVAATAPASPGVGDLWVDIS